MQAPATKSILYGFTACLLVPCLAFLLWILLPVPRLTHAGEPPSKTHSNQSPTTTPSAARTSQPGARDQILGAALFQKSRDRLLPLTRTEGGAKGRGNPGQTPQTILSLIGILVTGDGALAYFSDTPDQGRRPNQTLPGNWTLKTIDRDSVLLVKDGQEKRLTLLSPTAQQVER